MVQEAHTDTNTHPSPKGSCHYDMVVIGAGIHGISIACEANSRGLKVLLIHEGEICSASTCLPSFLQGAGLEYFEHLRIPSVRCNSEELTFLQTKAPHLVREMPTYIIEAPEIRSPRRVKLGLKVYQRLQGLGQSNREDQALIRSFQAPVYRKPTQEYSINYLRLAIGLLQRFKNGHSKLLIRHKLVATKREKEQWCLTLENLKNNEKKSINTAILVNCAGSNSSDIVESTMGLHSRGLTKQCQSLFLFAKTTHHWHNAAIIQLENKALMRVQPFGRQHLCIGPICQTTSEKPTHDTINAFLKVWNTNNTLQLTQDNIVHVRCNELPQVDDPSLPGLSFIQEAYLDLNNPGNSAPLLNLFGIDLIRFRRIAEQALDILEPFTRQKRDSFYRDQMILGGDFGAVSVEQYIQEIKDNYHFLPDDFVERLVFTYGKNCETILNKAPTTRSLGAHFGHNLYEAEVDYLKTYEWARSADDILWRRTYLGLLMNKDEIDKLQRYLG